MTEKKTASTNNCADGQPTNFHLEHGADNMSVETRLKI